MTVGVSVPQKVLISHNPKAIEVNSSRAEATGKSSLSVSYCSMYMRTVAPDPAVPDKRNINLDPSYMRKRIPCLAATEPSTGSTYLKSSAVTIV